VVPSWISDGGMGDGASQTLENHLRTWLVQRSGTVGFVQHNHLCLLSTHGPGIVDYTLSGEQNGTAFCEDPSKAGCCITNQARGWEAILIKHWLCCLFRLCLHGTTTLS
jgi:hypothetical protein